MLATENKQVIAITCKTIVGTITILLNRKIHFQRLSLNGTKPQITLPFSKKHLFHKKQRKPLHVPFPIQWSEKSITNYYTIHMEQNSHKGIYC